MVHVGELCPEAMRRETNWDIRGFSVLKILQDTPKSCVTLVECKATKIKACCKMYRKALLAPINVTQVYREVDIHSRLSHKHIVPLWAHWENDDNVFLVMEYCQKKDLFSHLHGENVGAVTERCAVRRIIRPTLLALRYLHMHGIVHRDVKPENIVFGENATLKLIDFGLSIDTSVSSPKTMIGTFDYMAPEVLAFKRDKRYSLGKLLRSRNPRFGIDVWAVGVLAYECLVGVPPFFNESKSLTLRHIADRDFSIPSWVSESASDFINRTLCAEDVRLTTLDALYHPWIQEHSAGEIISNVE